MNDTRLASTRPFVLPPRPSLAAADPGAPIPAQPDPAGSPDAFAPSGDPVTNLSARGAARTPEFSIRLPPPPPAHLLLVVVPGGGQARSDVYKAWLRAAQTALKHQRRIYLGGRVAVSLLCPRGRRADLVAQEKAPIALLVQQGIIDDARNVESLGLAWHDGRDLVVTVRKP